MNNLALEYRKIVQQSEKRGEIAASPQGRERREFPRLHVGSSDLWIDAVAQFTVADMSPSGVALLCSQPIELGELLNFSLGDEQLVEAQVMACELIESPEQNFGMRYRVQCRFCVLKQGMNLFVRAKQAKRQER